MRQRWKCERGSERGYGGDYPCVQRLKTTFLWYYPKRPWRSCLDSWLRMRRKLLPGTGAPPLSEASLSSSGGSDRDFFTCVLPPLVRLPTHYNQHRTDVG